MADTPKTEWLSGWGLIPRLMLAVGIAVVCGGGVQTALLVAEGASEHAGRLHRELEESLTLISPLIADQALVGDYAGIEQLLKNQVKKAEVDVYQWTDKDGRTIREEDASEKLEAPVWFTKLVVIDEVAGSFDVVAGGVSYGSVYAKMTTRRAHNRLWKQFVKQLQIVAATLLLLLQLIWLIFRGNLGTLRMLAESANRFSLGDHSVRIKAEGAAEVRIAAEAFNNMANNTESLLDSLSQSEQKNRLLATIVEQLSEAIWTLDRAGNVTSWNAGASAMFGYYPEEALGKPLAVSQAPAAEEEERMRRLLAGERFVYDVKAMTKNQVLIDIQVAVAPLLNEANECVGTIGVARDVTQNKRNEEALREARATAESASQAKSSFLARMSHEIRTPMNGVLGMTELLLETELTSVQRRYAETVQSSGNNLLAIINNILDFSKIEAGKLELEHVDMDVRKVVEDIVDLLAGRANAKKLELACDLPSDLNTYVRGDPLRLGQVLINLTGNAIKFTSKGGVIIAVSSSGETETHTTLRFDVTDTGLGIAEDAQARIFEEFSQADDSTTREYGGSGLGLAISRQLVDMMGGSIHVESQADVGSTFWFTCKFEKHSGHSSTEDHNELFGALTGRHALVVESTAVSHGILHSLLTGWGMNTRVVTTSREAMGLLVQARTAGTPFDLAVIDLGLSSNDSIEFARAVRAEPAIAETRLVMLSPVGSLAYLNEAQRVGINTCLVKPIRHSDLYENLVKLFADAAEAPEQHQNIPVDSADAAAPKALYKLLLVEDNVINQTVAVTMLRKIKGFNVVIANNGREALETLSKGTFDLILMDCHMPGMDGFEATRTIRRQEAGTGVHLPIVALTANAMEMDRQACLEAGMDDHLSKPFSRIQLEGILKRWLPATPATQGHPAADTTDAADPARAVLDRRILDQLRELRDDDEPDPVARIVQLYLDDSQQLLHRLKRAFVEKDKKELELASHSFKSSSANVGAAGLSGLCATLHTAVREARMNDVEGLLTRITTEHLAVCAALRDEL